MLATRPQNLGAFARYSIAIGPVAIGLMARLALEPLWQGRLPYITLFPAIMVSAWLGGLGPGIAATLLSGAGATYYWLLPRRSLGISDPGELVGLGVFILLGLVITGLNESWRRGTIALTNSEERLKVTLNSIGDAVLATDDSGRVSGMNDVAERLTGWTSIDAIGRLVEEVMVLVAEKTGVPLANPVTLVFQTGEPMTLEDAAVLVARDGRRTPIDITVAPIRVDEEPTSGIVLVFRDVSARQHLDAEREAQDRIARELAAIVETSDDAIVSKDLEGTVRSWNRGAERIFGYAASEMIGRSIRTIIPAERWSEEDDVLAQLRQGRRVDHFETVRRRKDGTEVHVSLTISPIRSAAGIVVGASKIARDITERRQSEAERARLLEREQAARAETERASRMKDEFLAVLSHELRTPLNAVMGYVQLLLCGAVPPDRAAHALQAIQRNAQAQNRLVESLLDLSRVLAGKLELNAEMLELPSVIASAVDAVAPAALKKNISIQVMGAESARVFADGARLQQVFWNLLSNAIKFTPPGGQVVVELATTDAEAVIRVRDNGRGIPASLLPFVFDRFKQGDESARSRTGLGLGLALVREMVNAHKGSVTAQSEGEGRGSTFTVRLPSAMLQEAGLPAAVQTGGRQRVDFHQSRPTVLIVDDERDAREMLALMLETRGAIVQHVASAAEAFDSMLRQRPDVLLSDIGMSDEDGFQFIRRWRAHEAEADGRGGANGRVAAIAVTAYASAVDRDMALTAGFDWHIAKPVDADELARIIAALQARAQRPTA
ncbi:MAG TPA: PAS domain S-box protein [Vicinamibacterales bacterium]|jgi:PAS domain S-box-containing protein|nr:PAS domain S-box protein [Vicinamibacterales bacterium]